MKKRQQHFLYPIVLSLLLVCAAAPAHAEVYLSGTADNVVLRAKNATMVEILSGIRSALNLRVELTGSTARQFTGTYAGSLRSVLSRLLVGEDHVIGSAPDGMTIFILSLKGSTPSPAPVIETKRINSGPPVRLAAAGDDGGNPNYQGWNPPSRIPFAKPASAAASVAPAPSNDGDIGKSQTEDTEGNPNYQGWAPTGNPFRAATVKFAPVVDNAAVPSAADKDEGNPNLQGYMPDWTPPAPGKSMRDAMPMPAVPAIGPHGQ